MIEKLEPVILRVENIPFIIGDPHKGKIHSSRNRGRRGELWLMLEVMTSVEFRLILIL